MLEEKINAMKKEQETIPDVGSIYFQSKDDFEKIMKKCDVCDKEYD